jgi:glycosyltransferase involved in cell wall biosynthesis
MSEHCVALLGRRDQPTDAVEEYCRYLGEALRVHDFDLELERVNWLESGWSAALSQLGQKARGWRGQWVLVQYTALVWSKHGFPLGFLRVIRLLWRAGVRIAVVYHDAYPYAGTGWVNRLRRLAQLRAMRWAFLASDFIVLTLPPQKLAWLPADQRRAVFIPVGANLPASIDLAKQRSTSVPTISVFGITGGETGQRETETIIEAVRQAAKTVGKLKLQVFGRHADLRERQLREGLQDFPVQLEIAGIIPAEEVACKLASSEVLLFMRGPISSRRGSAIAGIACGLPVVAYASAETAPPITEAGVVVVPEDNIQELGEALARVLADRPYRDALAAKSHTAYESHFSWPAIARQYAEALRRHP